MEDRKRCAKCGEIKPTSDFGKHKGWRDGFHPYCRNCKREADRRSHAKHRAQRNAKAKLRYRTDPEPYKERANRRYRESPDEVMAYVKRWQAENAEKVKRYKAKWVQENLSGAVRENTRRRYARRKGAFTIKFTPEQLAAKVAYWGNRCWLCGDPFQAIDHVKPLVVGGPHILANLRPICTSCNSRKRAAWPLPKGAQMVTSPSKRFEDGVLVERAIATNAPGDPEEIEAKATREYKAPVPTPRSPEEREALRDVRNQQDAEAEEKAVQSAENKAVASAETKATRSRKK